MNRDNLGPWSSTRLPVRSSERDVTTSSVTCAICVVTFKRPEGLTRLLESFRKLHCPDGLEVRVVVVDNDAAESAREVVDRCALVVPFPLSYAVEPERGLSRVRNTALRHAALSDWVAFIDDDEWPEPDWLERLVETQRQTGADVVLGPSVPWFDVPPPRWIQDGGFFERARFPTGQRIPFWRARTSGVMIRGASLANLGSDPFDDRFGSVGGEDRVFFYQLEKNGARIIWVDEAVVNECVPASRANARWLVRRGYRTGDSRSLMLVLVEDGSLARRVKRTGRGMYEMAVGLVALVTGCARTHTRIAAVQRVAIGAGLIAGAAGVRYEEYRVVHGR